MHCFVFIATKVDGKVSLQVFGGCTGCDLFVSSQPLISHTTPDVHKRFCGSARFPPTTFNATKQLALRWAVATESGLNQSTVKLNS
jgi:hypothetical protein